MKQVGVLFVFFFFICKLESQTQKFLLKMTWLLHVAIIRASEGCYRSPICPLSYRGLRMKFGFLQAQMQKVHEYDEDCNI